MGNSVSADLTWNTCLGVTAGGVALASSLGFLVTQWAFSQQPRSEWYQGKAVFITGCDSGLGFSFANYCHDLGMVVIAACHTASSKQGAEELERLGGSGRMFVIRDFDVRSKECIVMARNKVEEIISHTTTSLWAVVNNAAVLVLAKLEWQTDSLIESQLQVSS
jgi:NAD(P)-dependent dehydrogenase (short-subunit alcohol dehydrogenase family)